MSDDLDNQNIHFLRAEHSRVQVAWSEARLSEAVRREREALISDIRRMRREIAETR